MREKKYASDTRPIESSQKVCGIKRHIAVDTQGLPHAVQVTMAEVTDRKGALQATTDNRLVQGGPGSGPECVDQQQIRGQAVCVRRARRKIEVRLRLTCSCLRTY